MLAPRPKEDPSRLVMFVTLAVGIVLGASVGGGLVAATKPTLASNIGGGQFDAAAQMLCEEGYMVRTAVRNVCAPTKKNAHDVDMGWDK